MVSLDDAVIARLKKGDEHFEILVDPYAAADLIDGNEIDIIQSLAIDAVFKDSKQGKHASEESLQKNFGTEDVSEIAKQIILKGDIQLPWIRKLRLHTLVRELNLQWKKQEYMLIHLNQ